MVNWTISPGDWCHLELLTGDRDEAKRFWAKSSAGASTTCREPITR